MDGTAMGPYTLEPQLLRFRRRLRAGMRVAELCTPADLAREAHVADGTVMAYLRGTRLPGALTLVRISRALGVSCDWLLGFPVPMGREAE